VLFIPDSDFLPIPDPGVKKVATLVQINTIFSAALEPYFKPSSVWQGVGRLFLRKIVQFSLKRHGTIGNNIVTEAGTGT
jgi:hypothetical protein